MRLAGGRLSPAFTVFDRSRPLDGQSFPLTYFAFGPGGTIYADDMPGDDGFEAHQQLLEVTGGHIRLVWQQTNRSGA